MTQDHEPRRPRYGDVANLIKYGIPDPPTPTCLRRNDGIGTFYAGQINSLFGEPESGKTWVGLAAVVEQINRGGKAAVIDLDHNGIGATVTRLLATLGADQDRLGSLDHFRYAEPEDKAELMAVVQDLAQWSPHVVLLDSIGELLPALGLNSNSPDDFTIGHTAVLKPLARSGAAVIIIDHVAKNPEAAQRGPTGTAAKTRAVGGAMLRVSVKDAFAPGRGGSCYLTLTKDRHGGLRAATPSTDRQPLVGTFKLHPEGSEHAYSVYAAEEGESGPGAAPATDIASLVDLDPPPESVRDVANRLSWGTDRARIALKAFRSQEGTIRSAAA